jgi:hypothetical protein
MNLRVSPLRDAERVRARTLIVSGAGDTLASPRAVARLTTACGANKKFACRVPGGHGDVRAENPEVRKCIAGFVEDSAARPAGKKSAISAAAPSRNAPS